MIADSNDELIKMAKIIGVNTKHIQFKGLPKEHFDICKKMRNRAIDNGAIPISSKDIVLKIREKRELSKK